jgi:dUTPase
MVDLDDNYVKNAIIQSIVFHGQTIPGDNTIGADDLENAKDDIDGMINAPNDATTNYTITSGDRFIQNVFLRLMRAYVDENWENYKLTEDEERKIILKYGNPAIVCSNPDDDFDEPTPV